MFSSDSQLRVEFITKYAIQRVTDTDLKVAL